MQQKEASDRIKEYRLGYVAGYGYYSQCWNEFVILPDKQKRASYKRIP